MSTQSSVGEPEPRAGAPAPATPKQAVRTGVLAALGRPPGLYGVDVRPLWAGRYRVNVLVGPDPTAVRVAHSYLVAAGPAGDIRTADPRITRLYA